MQIVDENRFAIRYCSIQRRERWKVLRNRRALWERHVEQMSPEAAVDWTDPNAEPDEGDWTQVETTHVFVPLGFDARTGAFGPRTRTFLREVVEVADATSSTDLYHWCAMVWGEQGEQRLGAKLAQGEARLVLGAVASARANAEGFSWRKASPEWSPTDCQPCASL
jgi:hypothetical protein